MNTTKRDRGRELAIDALLAANKEIAQLKAEKAELVAMIRDVQMWLAVHLHRGDINCGTANRDGDLVSQLQSLIAKHTKAEEPGTTQYPLGTDNED